MKKFLLIAILFLLAGICIETNAQTFSGSIANGTIKRGTAGRATIVMNIPRELHVNSNRPDSEYAIPTSVRVTAPGLKVGTVMYPRGRNRKFEFSDNAINVYEGRVAFNFNVNVPANYRGNTIRVRAVVRYQACTNSVCYPPKNQDVILTAKVN